MPDGQLQSSSPKAYHFKQIACPCWKFQHEGVTLPEFHPQVLLEGIHAPRDVLPLGPRSTLAQRDLRQPDRRRLLCDSVSDVFLHEETARRRFQGHLRGIRRLHSGLRHNPRDGRGYGVEPALPAGRHNQGDHCPGIDGHVRDADSDDADVDRSSQPVADGECEPVAVARGRRTADCRREGAPDQRGARRARRQTHCRAGRAWKTSSSTRRKWKRWAVWPAGWRTISTICSP